CGSLARGTHGTGWVIKWRRGVVNAALSPKMSVSVTSGIRWGKSGKSTIDDPFIVNAPGVIHKCALQLALYLGEFILAGKINEFSRVRLKIKQLEMVTGRVPNKLETTVMRHAGGKNILPTLSEQDVPPGISEH